MADDNKTSGNPANPQMGSGKRDEKQGDRTQATAQQPGSAQQGSGASKGEGGKGTGQKDQGTQATGHQPNAPQQGSGMSDQDRLRNPQTNPAGQNKPSGGSR
ncbi:MAG: hypothetical protein JWO51_5073 [Rhodospirillales bacterium]|nr:hypothetical protein [Rhodospirillales bacterium]